MAETMIGIKPLHDRILVGIYDDGDTTMMLGGKKFFLLDDTSATRERDIHTKHQGVRPRWAIVLATSDTNQGREVKPGDKVLLDELKWSRGMMAPLSDGTKSKVWSIPLEDVLAIDSDGFKPMDEDQITKLYPNWQSWTTEVR